MNQTDNYRKYKAKNPVQHRLIERFLTTVLREARIIHPKTILEAGCGEGFILERLYKANIGQKQVGIDFSDAAIALDKKERPHLDIRKGDIYNIPFKDNAFDLVLCCEVLEHLENPQKALSELHRVTRQYVILSVPNEPWFMLANLLRGKNVSRFGNDIEHINHWSGDEFEKFVGTKFTVFTRKQPFPWSIFVAEKK
ncbi:MAG: class I SAM-dependent methyltransferase [Candidatus Levybacteria bacterium]|nr:class I SAM-dependent methyltransferase [Candidatus Levybacteria bacterium]